MANRTGSISASTRRRISSRAGALATAAVHQIHQQHQWYRGLSAQDRAWVGTIAQSGITDFLSWFDATASGSAEHEVDIFASAPRELTRSISLRQTLDLIRTVVAVVEREVVDLAEDADREAVREAMLVYSREVAFDAAGVYAGAAEARGAWDARLESLVVDAVLRAEADDSLRSRAAALGWGEVSSVAVAVAQAPAEGTMGLVEDLHRAARDLGVTALATVQGRRVVVILGGTRDPVTTVSALTDHFGPGPIVVGPVVPHLFAAGRSARAALAGYAAAPAWPDAPRPTPADDLLAERAIAGDLPARATLLDRIWAPLSAPSNDHLLATTRAYLTSGGSTEGSARQLFIHPNTVRYRLTKIVETTGYDPADPHDALAIQLALVYAALPRPSTTTPAPRL